jgi:Sec-independent protein secretion pathway component TatC
MALLTRHAPYHRVRGERDTDEALVEREHTANVAERIVWLVAGIIIALLAFRFIFALLGANPGNGIVNFVYDTSHPFVAPFFNMFNYNFIDDGAGRFEIFTLIAIAVYGVIAWGLARLVSINRP